MSQDQPLRVLLVEDSEDDALLLIDALRRDGFAPQYRRVATAAAFRAALAEESWDIILADYALPQIGGLDALRLVQDQGLDIPLIIVSSKIGEDLAVDAVRAGARDYVLKSYLTRLAPAVKREIEEANLRRRATEARLHAEEALRRSHEELEQRVEKRTAELRETNALLSIEIAERKQTEETLARERELFQRILDTIPVMITIYDPNLQTFRFNQGVRQLLGWTEDDAAGGDFLSMVYPDPAYRQQAVEYMRSLETGWHDWTVTAKDGTQVESSWANIRLPDGTRVGVGIDIRERKRAEKVLRESETLFRSLAENANALIGIIQGTKFVYVNPYFTHLSGYSREELLELDIRQVIAPQFLDMMLERARLRQAGAPSLPSRYEFSFITKDGQQRWLDFSVALTEYHGQPAITGIAYDITERKQAEEALRDSEERYHVFSEAGSEGVAIHEHGIILEVNRIIAEHLGYTPEEMRGRPLFGFVAPESRAEVIRRMQAEDPGPYLAVSLHRDGTKSIGEMRARNFIYHGREVRMVAMRDVTVQKQLEQERARLLIEVQRRAEELDAILDTIVDPTSAFDANGILIRANPAMVLTIGHDPTGMTHAEIARVLLMRRPDGTLFAETETPISRALRGEPVVSERLLITDVDQHIMIVLVSAAPLLEKGKPWGVVSIWHDISKRERALEETQRRAAELDASLSAVGDGLIIYSPTGEILRMNPAAERMLGFTEEEGHKTIGERWMGRCIMQPNGTPLPTEDIPAELARHGQTVQGSIIACARKDGAQIWLSVSAAPIYAPDGRQIGEVATFTDITPLQDLQEQMRSVLQTIAHDLRNPLSVITGHMDLLSGSLSALTTDEQVFFSVGAIQRSAQRMNAMIEDLVDAARQEGGKLELQREPVNLRGYLVDFLHRNAEVMATDRIRLEVPEELPPVSADNNRLERIFTNLLSNALKYSDPGTPVWVRARFIPSTVEGPTAGSIEIAVSDQGKGIAPEDLPHLFERFYRTSGARKAEGIGLGLCIARILVEAHGLPAVEGTAKVGGRIWVESTPGQGSTFYFTLPIAEGNG